jgi:hypothetical protein
MKMKMKKKQLLIEESSAIYKKHSLKQKKAITKTHSRGNIENSIP